MKLPKFKLPKEDSWWYIGTVFGAVVLLGSYIAFKKWIGD